MQKRGPGLSRDKGAGPGAAGAGNALSPLRFRCFAFFFFFPLHFRYGSFGFVSTESRARVHLEKAAAAASESGSEQSPARFGVAKNPLWLGTRQSRSGTRGHTGQTDTGLPAREGQGRGRWAPPVPCRAVPCLLRSPSVFLGETCCARVAGTRGEGGRTRGLRSFPPFPGN